MNSFRYWLVKLPGKQLISRQVRVLIFQAPQFPILPVLGKPAVSLESCPIVSLSCILTTKVSEGYTMLIFGSHMPSAHSYGPTIISRAHNAAIQHYSIPFSTGWPPSQHTAEHPSVLSDVTHAHLCFYCVCLPSAKIQASIHMKSWRPENTCPPFHELAAPGTTCRGREP